MLKVNPIIPINHPMANRISIQNSEHHHATPGVSSELAFFMDTEWVVDIIPEFADYHDGSPSDASTCTYGWVPEELVYEFMQKYGA